MLRESVGGRGHSLPSNSDERPLPQLLQKNMVSGETWWLVTDAGVCGNRSCLARPCEPLNMGSSEDCFNLTEGNDS